MSETRHTVDPKFVMQRQGKDMVLYAGLVDAAHRAGLIAIKTEIVQFPTKDNDHTTIVQATAVFPSPGDDSENLRAFSGIGDANPQNVGKNIAPHSIRMAETRAKARALRDALNIGMVTVEELGGDDEPSAHPAPAQPQPAPSAPPFTAEEYTAAIQAAWRLRRETTFEQARGYLTEAKPRMTADQRADAAEEVVRMRTWTPEQEATQP